MATTAAWSQLNLTTDLGIAIRLVIKIVTGPAVTRGTQAFPMNHATVYRAAQACSLR